MATAKIVAGLAFGDESKGATVDALCRHFPADLIVRYNGGCQCAHSVVTPEGSHHVFSQFGAGMLAGPKVRAYLSKYVLVEPLAMMREADALSKLTPNVWERTSVSVNAPIVTPLHRQLNRLREEARGVNRHGSCGRGIGVTRELHLRYGGDVLLAGDFLNRKIVAEKLNFLWDVMKEELFALLKAQQGRGEVAGYTSPDDVMRSYEERWWPARIVDYFEPAESMIFEGAQGVMLDETFGSQPHVTWTNTTFANADALLDAAGVTDRMRIGCLRSYYTRHGAGPLPTEDAALSLPEPHNGNDGFQGKFRLGQFDFDLAAHAITIVGGVDALAISHLDYLPALGWDHEEHFLSLVEGELGVRIGMIGRGPTAADREIKTGVFDVECPA